MPLTTPRSCHAVSALVFAVVALAHASRVVAGIPIRAGNTDVPIALSWGVAIGAGVLAAWAWRCRRG